MDHEVNSSAALVGGGRSGGGDDIDDARRRDTHHRHRISSSSGADEASETDELTTDDFCVNNGDKEAAVAVDMDGDNNDNNVAIVSSSTSSTLHQMSEEEDEDLLWAAASGYMSMSWEPEAVAVTTKPLHGDDDDTIYSDYIDEVSTSQQSLVTTTATSDSIVRNPAEVDDVDLEDGEIMDDEDEEEDVKAPPPPSKARKEQEKEESKKTSSSSSSEGSLTVKKDINGDKDKERGRGKQHWEDKMRSKREEEKDSKVSRAKRRRESAGDGPSWSCPPEQIPLKPSVPRGQGENSRNPRWKQQLQVTRDDEKKLQALMEEAGISEFYKECLGTGVTPRSATLHSITTSQASEDWFDKPAPHHIPKLQQELFMRIQKTQQKNEKKMQNLDKLEPEEREGDWYSSDDENSSKKKKDKSEPEEQEEEEDWYSCDDEDSAKETNKKNAKIRGIITSVYSQIRQQTSQPQSSSSPVFQTTMSLPSFYGDTDFRNPAPSYSFKDVDLRNRSSIFKKMDIEPAKEINASLAHNGPMPYKVRKVAGIPKIDYSSIIRMGLPLSTIVLDPRLGPKRNNSILAPPSSTEASNPDVGIQPLTIPDAFPVFDPRTRRAGGQGSSGPGRGSGAPGISPQQNNPFLDSDNRFVSFPNSGMNDFLSLFNPRGGGMPNMQTPGIYPTLRMMNFPFLLQQAGGVQNPFDFQQMMAASGAAGNLRMTPPFTPHQQQPSSSWERLNQGQQGQEGGDLTPPP